MSGGCNAKADCQASCDASVQAHAQCTPPDLKVTGGANLAPLLATLEKNLPVLITVVQAQSKAIANAATSVETSVANLGNLDPSVAGCVVSYAIKAGNAGTHVKAALSGATSVTVAAGVK
jgi:hypothetical protein